MKKFKILVLSICLVLPFLITGCSNFNRQTLETPNNLTVETGGLITFERSSNEDESEDYYTIAINDVELNVFPLESNFVDLYTYNGINYLQYDASKIFVLGESYSIRVQARGESKRSSDYTNTISYTHTIPMSKPNNVQINGTVLTWEAVENASFYLVKVVTPYDDLALDDAESVANSTEISSYQFSTNRFDFSSLLTGAGYYKFYVNAVSYDSRYTDSGYTSKTVYFNEVPLDTPTSPSIYSVTSVGGEESLHLITVLDPNANAITIRSGEYVKTIELNSVEPSLSMTDNMVDINLNVFFRDVVINGATFDLTQLKQYEFRVQANYVTTNEQEKYYIDSNFTTATYYSNTTRLEAPVLKVNFDELSQRYIASWVGENLSNISGFNLYIFTENNSLVDKYTLDKNISTFTLPDDYNVVFVQAVGQGAYISSPFSNFVNKTSSTIDEDIEISLSGNGVIWTETPGATYIVELDNNIVMLQTNYIDLLAYDGVIEHITIHIISADFAIKTVSADLSYTIQLATPIIGSGQGFQDSEPYVLTFTGVNNAIGYYVYLMGRDNTEAVRINRLFTSTVIDLSQYIIKEGEYRDYYVQIQAVAAPYSGYTNSELTTLGLLVVSHQRVLSTPEFLRNDSNEPAPVVRRVINGRTYYYLCFYGVEFASRYEVMVNFNTINVPATFGLNLYEVDITNYVSSANSYTIMVRALPSDSESVKPSSYATYEFVLTMQLNQVTNIRVAENDGIYTLSFDMQDNAASYRVRIVKINDGTYTDYLYDLGLQNPFEVIQSTDITEYVRQAGEYYIYVTALAPKNSYYGDSDESSTYAILNKLTTLNTPTDIRYANNSADEFLVSWTGDDHADYYIIRVTDPNGEIDEYHAYDTEMYNINDSITVEGNYLVSIKSMVNSTGNNAMEYTSSPFSDDWSIYYTYTIQHDFERYSVYMYGSYYDFAIDDVDDLMNLLWYHYLFGVDDEHMLSMYLRLDEGESVVEALERLAQEATDSVLYNFTGDDVWLGYLDTASESTIFSYLCEKLLELYPELNVLSEINVSHDTNSQIFKIYYENLLDEPKVDTPNTYIQLATDYGNDYEYLDIYSRRNTTTSFTIDSLPEMDVTTTEQLLMAVQYGRKPRFVGDSTVAEQVYANAKSVLISIINNNMTDLEKVTAIFDWLEYAYNLNYYANMTTSGGSIVEGTVADYGLRKEFYLEGIFYDLNNSAVGGHDGEFYLGNRNATAQAYSKAFTLLCAIEGIETRKVNGTYTYVLNGDNVSIDHSWNKVYLDVTDNNNARIWYSLDLTYSDNYYVPYNFRDCYGMSSHLYFLVTDSFLSEHLNLLESNLVELPVSNTTYDYYANATFGMTVDEINATISGAGSDIDDFTYMKEYIENGQVTYQIYDRTQGYSQLQAYVMNAVLYAKYNQLLVNESNRSSFEFRVSRSAMMGNTSLPSNSTIETIVADINSYYSNSIYENVNVDVINLYDTVNEMTTYIFTLEFS